MCAKGGGVRKEESENKVGWRWVVEMERGDKSSEKTLKYQYPDRLYTYVCKVRSNEYNHTSLLLHDRNNSLGYIHAS